MRIGSRIALLALCAWLSLSPRAGQGQAAQPFNDMFASWSPDGSQIAFTSDRTGDPEIYVARADGTRLRQLTSTPGRDAHPSWSRDGRRLFFQSPREQGQVRIFAMRPDGTGQASLAKTTGFCGVPFQSPASRDIVFQCSGSLEDFGSKENPWRIFLLSPGQEMPRPITFGPGNDQVATWSPDGRRILFYSDRTGIDQIYELALRTGRIRQLTFGPASHRAASYARDWKRIALMRAEPNQKADVFVLNLPGDFVRITRTGPQFGAPTFSRDGRMLLFQMPTSAGSRIFVAPANGSAPPNQLNFAR